MKPCPMYRTLLLFIGFVVFAQPARSAETGSSHNLIIKARLGERFYLASRSNLATKKGFSENAIQYADLTLGVSLNQHWSMDAGFRQARIQLSSGWRHESRPLINLNWKALHSGYFISNRFRVEGRLFHDQAEDRVRLRNEIRLVTPWEIPKWGARVFFEEEAFYEFNDDGFNRHWLTGGLRFKLAEGCFAKLGYRWTETEFSGHWSTRHVGVTGLILFF